jgi:hypothetical protein
MGVQVVILIVRGTVLDTRLEPWVAAVRRADPGVIPGVDDECTIPWGTDHHAWVVVDEVTYHYHDDESDAVEVSGTVRSFGPTPPDATHEPDCPFCTWTTAQRHGI